MWRRLSPRLRISRTGGSWHHAIYFKSCTRDLSTSSKSASLSGLTIHQKFGESRSREYKVNQQNDRLEKCKKEVPLNLKLLYSYENALSYFLPKGYPSSVGVGYKFFALGQMTSVVLSTAGGVLSMQALLTAIGVGSSSTLPLAATVNWVLKDGLGQLGGVIFASLVSNRFDADPKRWRILASISMDIASMIELLTPLYPGNFLMMASIANVGKNVSFLAASASRAAIHKTFAIHENLGDITAKTGSQWTMASVLGTSLGISISALVGSHYSYTVIAFASLSLLSTSMQYFSLRQVTLSALSIARLDCILQHYLKSHEVLSPKTLTSREVWLGSAPAGIPKLFIGCNLDDIFKSQQEMKEALDIFHDCNYVLYARSWPREREADVHIVLKSGADKRDILQGLTQAYLVRDSLRKENINPVGPYEQLLRTIGLSSFVRKRLNTADAVTRLDLLIATKKTIRSKYHLPGQAPIQPSPPFGTVTFGRINSTVGESVVVQQIAANIADKASQEQGRSPSVASVGSGLTGSGGSSSSSGSVALNFGEKVVDDILRSEWLVEELMLETRVARLSVESEPPPPGAGAPEVAVIKDQQQ